MSSIRGALLLSTLISACGGQQVAVPEATPAAPDPSYIVRIEPRDNGFGLHVIEQTEESTLAILGAQRLELRTSGDSRHTLSFTTAIARAGRCGEGWLFLSSDGVVAYSPTFTGPLERVLEVPIKAVSGMMLSGPTFVHAHGSLLEVDCSDGVRVIDHELDFPINAIDDGNRIVATTRFGLMIQDHDAEGWRRLDLGGRVAWMVMMSDTAGESYVWISDPDALSTPFVLGADDLLHAFVPPAAEADAGERDEGLYRRFARALPSLAPFNFAPYGRTLTSNGAWLQRAEDRSIWLHDGSGHSFEVMTPAGENTCTPRYWPSQAIVECGDALYRVVVDEVMGRARTERFGTLPANVRSFLPASPHGGIVQKHDGTRAWFDVRTGEWDAFDLRDAVVIPAGDRVVLREYEADNAIGGWLQASYGDSAPTPLPEPFFSCVEPIVAAEGSLWAATRRNNGTIERLFTMVGAEARSVPVPEGTLTFRVYDRDTMWLARSATDVLQSLNGGADWQSVPGDILAGEARSLDLAAMNHWVLASACTLPCDLGFDASIHQVSEAQTPARILARSTPQANGVSTEQALYECVPAEPLTLFDGETTQVRGRNVRWTGVDGRGTYSKRARLPSGSLGCRVWQSSRRDALVRCGDEGPESELFLLTAESAPRAISSQVRGSLMRTREAGVVIRGTDNLDSISGWTRDGVLTRRDFASTDRVGRRVLAILDGRPAHGFLRGASPNSPWAYVMRFLDGAQERTVLPLPVDPPFCDPHAEPSSTQYSMNIPGLRLQGLSPVTVQSFLWAHIEVQPAGPCIRRVSSPGGFEAWAGQNETLLSVRESQTQSVHFVHARGGEAREFTHECSRSLQVCAADGELGDADVQVLPGERARFELGESTLAPSTRTCLEQQLAHCTGRLRGEPFAATIRVHGTEPPRPMRCTAVAD